MSEKLYIKANSIESCDLLSSLLQDSILHVSCHSFHDERKCLRLMLNRFCWESVSEFDKHRCYFRVHSGLYIHGVNSIVVNDNFRKNKEKYMNFLAMHSSKNEINLVFSGHKYICINTNEIQVHLKDLHDRYPTLSHPSHVC